MRSRCSASIRSSAWLSARRRLDVRGTPAQRRGDHIGLVGGFIFGVYLQNVSAGAYVTTLTLVTGLPEVLISVSRP